MFIPTLALYKLNLVFGCYDLLSPNTKLTYARSMEAIKTHCKILLAKDEQSNIKDIMLINYQRDNTFKKPNSDLKRNWDLVQRNSYSVLSAK